MIMSSIVTALMIVPFYLMSFLYIFRILYIWLFKCKKTGKVSKGKYYNKEHGEQASKRQSIIKGHRESFIKDEAREQIYHNFRANRAIRRRDSGELILTDPIVDRSDS